MTQRIAMKRLNRLADRLYRRLFPEHAKAVDQLRAERLRRQNRIMQLALDQWNRSDDAAWWLERNIRHTD